jgi:hypothetical protein
MLLNEIKSETNISVMLEALDGINVDFSTYGVEEIKQLMSKVLQALSVVGKLKPGPLKSKHVSRIFTFMNKVRGAIVQMVKNSDAGAQYAESIECIDDVLHQHEKLFEDLQ